MSPMLIVCHFETFTGFYGRFSCLPEVYPQISRFLRANDLIVAGILRAPRLDFVFRSLSGLRRIETYVTGVVVKRV